MLALSKKCYVDTMPKVLTYIRLHASHDLHHVTYFIYMMQHNITCFNSNHDPLLNQVGFLSKPNHTATAREKGFLAASHTHAIWYFVHQYEMLRGVTKTSIFDNLE